MTGARAIPLSALLAFALAGRPAHAQPLPAPSPQPAPSSEPAAAPQSAPSSERASPQPAPPPQPAPGAVAPAAPKPPPGDEGGWIARVDELYKTRDQAASQREMNKLLQAALSRDPTDFEANWRVAQLLAYQANGMPDGSEVKAAVGKAAWEAGDKAAAARGDDVRGQYWAAVGIGLYSEGVGILTALSQGLESKFRSRAQAALRLDKDYLDGGPQMLWGRFFYKLPWPKRDVDESVRVLSAAAKEHPHNLRLKLFLADSLADSDRKDEARKLVQEILDAPLRDPPDDKRNKEWARQRNY